MKRLLIPLVLASILILAVLVAPVSAGLTITDGDKITSSNGVTLTVITVKGVDIPDGGTITINVSSLHAYVASPPFTEANVEVWSDAVAAGWWGVMDADGINLTLMSAGGNTTSGESIFVTFTGATGYPWVDDSGGDQTLPLTVTRTDTSETATINFMIETVSGLKITDGETIISPYGATSPVITVIGSDIPDGGTITIDLFYTKGFMASWTFTDANIAISSNATASTWTAAVTGDTLMLTSTGGPTLVGETIIVTFSGTAGNPWIAYSGGPVTYPLTATRSDGYDPKSFSISMDMIPPVSTGLSIENGAPVTTTLGATSPVITVTEPIDEGGNITIFVPFLSSIIASGNLNDTTIVINDTAVNANWTSTVTSDRVILTSTGGSTAAGETVNVTFTGAANPWIVSIPVGVEYPYTTAVRGDGLGTGYFTFAISTQDPTNLIISEGAKINATNGATSPVITVTGTEIVPEGTIIIDVSGLNTYVASGNFTTANLRIDDTAANATWTGEVTADRLTLTSKGGATAADENITVTFTGTLNPWIANTNGEITIPLFVSRIDGAGGGSFNLVIETTPPSDLMVTANFSALPTSDMAPLTVQFNDSSLGSPTSWNWDFGDGNYSTLRDPVNTYYTPGIYTVSLTATNAYGSDIKTKWDYIKVLTGTIREANTTIDGLTVTNCGGPQTIAVDTSILPAALIPVNSGSPEFPDSTLDIQPPADSGFKNITIYAFDGAGFSQNGNLITGNPTGVHLVTEDMAPLPGFSADIGTNASLNIGMDLSSYPCNAVLSTKIWDGIITEYNTKLWWISSNNSAVPVRTAYTANITKTNFSNATNVKVRMSVNSDLKYSGENVFIWRIADDGNSGQILPTTFLGSDPVNNLDYFEADSPLGLSTLGISSFDGSNNPFQIITFVLSEVISPPENVASSESSNTYEPGAVVSQNTTSSMTELSVPSDPGITARIYANAQGIITQATTLQSADGFATVTIGTGIVAKALEKKPLSAITIKAIPPDNLPDISPDGSLSFTGRAYELLPEGATFSPGIAINFVAPDMQPSQNIQVKMYDHATETWQDVPSSINPETGIITAHISHFCCIALFAETVLPESAPASTPAPAQPRPNAPVPTAMSTVVGMILWVSDLILKNILIFIGIIAIAVAIFLHGRKRRRDRMKHLT